MIDLSTLKVGDKVKTRDDHDWIVEDVVISKGDYPVFIRKISPWGTIGQVSFTFNGRWMIDRETDGDIVKIIPKEEVENDN